MPKLALTSLQSGGRSVGIVRLRTQATEFFFFSFLTPSSLFNCNPISNAVTTNKEVQMYDTCSTRQIITNRKNSLQTLIGKQRDKVKERKVCQNK
jgi:hypothetical protein